MVFRRLGFSLIEGMIVVFVIVCVTIGAIPLWRTFFYRNQVDARVEAIVSAVNYAKAQAIHSKKTLVLTPLSGTQDWSLGMQLFTDSNHNQALDNDEQLMRIWQWQPDKVMVVWYGFRSDHYLVFEPNLDNGALSGHFIVQSKNNQRKRNVIINRVGRIRVTT